MNRSLLSTLFKEIKFISKYLKCFQRSYKLTKIFFDRLWIITIPFQPSTSNNIHLQQILLQGDFILPNFCSHMTQIFNFFKYWKEKHRFWKTDGYKHSIITFNNLVFFKCYFIFLFLDFYLGILGIWNIPVKKKSPYLSIPVFSCCP